MPSWPIAGMLGLIFLAAVAACGASVVIRDFEVAEQILGLRGAGLFRLLGRRAGRRTGRPG
jgi:threonine/homoserine/homoserine lactone efflux protein